MSNWTPTPSGDEENDPRPIDDSLSRLAKTFKVEDPSVIADVKSLWTELIANEPIASKVSFEGFHNGTIFVNCTDRSWTSQVKMAHANIIKVINSKLGEGTVFGVEVRSK